MISSGSLSLPREWRNLISLVRFVRVACVLGPSAWPVFLSGSVFRWPASNFGLGFAFRFYRSRFSLFSRSDPRRDSCFRSLRQFPLVFYSCLCASGPVLCSRCHAPVNAFCSYELQPTSLRGFLFSVVNPCLYHSVSRSSLSQLL
jgi:hypothetical protein